MMMKKLLSLVLCAAMVLGTMSTVVLADGEAVLGGADFETNGGVVFDGTNYYDTLTAALAGVHGTDNAILYCKPEADLGTMTHGHVCKNLTVYGNGAEVTGGEQDFEIDMYECPGIGPVGSSLTGDVTLKVYNLVGAGAWGTRQSAYTVNYIFEDCEDMGKIYITGATGTNNISLTDCTFTSNEVSACKVYSNAAGTISLTNVDFSGIDQPVALNNKSTGKQTISLKDCDFTSCGASTQDYTVPVSVKSSVEGGTSALTVDNCTFTGTVANSIGQDADILLDYGVGETTSIITNTAAKVGVETAANELAGYAELTSEDVVAMTNESAETTDPIASFGGTYFATLDGAIAAAAETATEGNPVTVQLAAGTFEVGDFDLPNMEYVTIKGAADNATIIKNSVIKNAGAASDNLAHITFDDLTFDNSRIYVNGWTAGMNFADWTITNCEFINLSSDTSIGGVVQFNLSSGMIVGQYGPYNDVALDGFTFTNNTVSGAHANNVCSAINSQAMEGEIVIENNTFNDVDYNALQLQNVPDSASVSIKNNTFTNIGAQIVHLNNNLADVDINENTFVITGADKLYISHISTEVEASDNFFGIGTSVDDAVFDTDYKNKFHITGETPVPVIIAHYDDAARTNRIIIAEGQIGDAYYPTLDDAITDMIDEIDETTDITLSSDATLSEENAAALFGKSALLSIGTNALTIESETDFSDIIEVPDRYRLVKTEVTDDEGNVTAITYTLKKKPSSSSAGGGLPTSAQHTVTFETNGGSAIEKQLVEKGTALTEPAAPEKEGFIFDGWYTDEELTEKYDFETIVNGNFTLYASWKEASEGSDTTEGEIDAFVDLDKSAWYILDVDYVLANGLMNGMGENTFGPDENLTRAMLVTILYRNEGEPATNRSIPFADIDMSAYYANAVVWGQQNGIITGVSDTEFAPDNNITREQIATIMFRYSVYKGMDAVTMEENLHFDDAAEISEYAISAMNWAVGTGLMNGRTETTINPKDLATRAEIAAILHRYIEGNK